MKVNEPEESTVSIEVLSLLIVPVLVLVFFGLLLRRYFACRQSVSASREHDE